MYRELVDMAYKKIKSSIYFDKTQSILRNKIVEFESNEDTFNKSLDEIADALENEEKFNELKGRILKTIDVNVFPKSIKQESDKNIIKNFNDKSCEIEKLKYFIDMDVRGHILGVIWIMKIGYLIDSKIYEHSYGNRIRKTLINEFSKKPTFSPYLFEPYFIQYESWRDKALDKTQRLFANNQDAVVITLDFKEFYHSVDISESDFEFLLNEALKIKYDYTEEQQDEAEKSQEEALCRFLNKFVCEVVDSYSKKFGNEYGEKHILPIGFLPSNIIANWCLKNFDKAIVDGWNPVYYGRYVDDVLIIEKVEKNSDVYKKIHENNIDIAGLINYFMGYCSRWQENKNFDCKGCSIYETKKCDNIKCSIIPLVSSKVITNKEKNENDIEYTVNSQYNITTNNKSEIKFQNSKLKAFYFDSTENYALIRCFQENISKNKSEFRQMPEDNAVFQDDDYTEIYKIKNDESINKFRGLGGVVLDKYNLSKFIGKYLRIGNLVNDKSESKLEKDLLIIFDNNAIIENYTLWEKILTILVVNENYKLLKEFIFKIIFAIEKIKYNDNNKQSKIKDSLFLTLFSAIMRAFSIVYSKKTNEIFESLIRKKTEFSIYFFKKFLLDDSIIEMYLSELFNKISKYRLNYILTKMSDKTLLPVMIDSVDPEFIIKKDVNFSNFHCILKIIEDGKCNRINLGYKQEYKYYPYIINMYDIVINHSFSKMVDYKEEKFELDKFCEEEKKAYATYNYLTKNHTDLPHEININCKDIKDDNYLISVGKGKKAKLNIAVANVKLNHSNFEKNLQGKPNRCYTRYKELSMVVNEAIKRGVDMLIMPESFVPFEWLSTLARTCAKNKLAVVTGVEHIVINKKVFNLTAVILPYSEKPYECSYISFHLKKHYAPNEDKEIRAYEYTPVKGTHYELYKWNDCYFPVYCCFELSSIKDRSIFQSYSDMLIAVECNKDTKYYSNILESLSRDIHCYCIQANTSDYGDSRITEPSKSETKDLIRTKGGKNSTILVGEVDIKALREFQSVKFSMQCGNHRFKPTPPQFNREIALKKLQGDDDIFES
ncbi:MAG: hypothetical protein IJ583_09610 [Firmicutes bacterium]|nr:hypothetical protein [Bacillota bacterium]